LEVLGTRLQALPALISQTLTVPLGVYRGLRFGIVLHPHSAPEVTVEGALTRSAPLSREFHGPRAILNALERLVSGYEAERDTTAREVSIAQGQQRDYEARLGAGFAHAGYLEELTTLRNQLEAALSSNTQQVSEEPLAAVGNIVQRIKTLQAAHTLEVAPARTAPRHTATVEEAITTRIRRREQTEPAPQPEMAPPPVLPVTPAPLPLSAPEPAARLFHDEGERPSPATPAHPPRRMRPKHRCAPRQLSLWQPEVVHRSPTASLQERQEPWLPPRQLTLL
jgi:hypothetical protein